MVLRLDLTEIRPKNEAEEILWYSISIKLLNSYLHKTNSVSSALVEDVWGSLPPVLFARCEKPVALTDHKSSCGKPEGVRSEPSGSKVDILYFHGCSAAVFLRSCHQELAFSFPFCTLVCSSTGQR